jgi:hypothetical protein
VLHVGRACPALSQCLCLVAFCQSSLLCGWSLENSRIRATSELARKRDLNLPRETARMLVSSVVDRHVKPRTTAGSFQWFSVWQGSRCHIYHE